MSLSETKKKELRAIADAWCKALVALAEKNRKESRAPTHEKS